MRCYNASKGIGCVSSACWQPPQRGRGADNRTFGGLSGKRDIKPIRPGLLADQEVISNAIPVQQTRSKKPELYEVLDLGDRVCHTCGQSKESWDFYREPAEPFRVKKVCKQCITGIHAYPSDNIPETDVIRKQKQRILRLEEEFRQTNGQARFDHMMQRLQQSAKSSRDESAYKSALHVQDPLVYEGSLKGIQDMLLMNRNDAILLVREQPELLLLGPELLAERVVELKSVVPKANIQRLLQLGPWLLLLSDISAQLEPVLRQLQVLMPSFDIHTKLHDGSGVWWSASDMLKSNKRSFSYTAGKPLDEEAIPKAEDVRAKVEEVKEKFEADIDHAIHYGGLNI